MTRRRLLVATRSTHKLRELRELLELEHTDLVSLDDLGIEGDPIEDGATFETNAAIKARFGLRASGLPTLADDSGIEVDALGGAPGVRTRRFAGETATDEANNAKLLSGPRRAPAPSAAAPATCACSQSRSRTPSARVADRGWSPRGARAAAGSRSRRAGAAGSATTRSSSPPPSRLAAGLSAFGRPRRSTRSRIAPERPGGWRRGWSPSGSDRAGPTVSSGPSTVTAQATRPAQRRARRRGAPPRHAAPADRPAVRPRTGSTRRGQAAP